MSLLCPTDLASQSLQNCNQPPPIAERVLYHRRQGRPVMKSFWKLFADRSHRELAISGTVLGTALRR